MVKDWPFYILVLTLFLFLIGKAWLSDGMFLDGVLYAAVSRNMADGFGSIWMPYYTANWNAFYEHPPLAFWLQSLVFKVFGDSIFVERIYSVGTFIMTGWILVKIWKQLTGASFHGWLPLLLWAIVPTVFWAATNNMLENTMMIFTTLSIFFLVKSEHRWYYLVAAGGFIFLAFLSKGVFALFVLSAPFWRWVFLGKRSFGRMVIESFVLVISTILPFIVIVLFDSGIYTNISNYIFHQVINSIAHVQTVSHRFTVLLRMFSDLTVPVAVCLLTIILPRVGGIRQHLTPSLPYVKFLMALGLSGVLPIMVSLKQSSFYILATYPFFALALALWVAPIVSSLFSVTPSKYAKIIYLGSLLLFTASVIFVCSFIGKAGRDQEELSDVHLICSKLVPGSKIAHTSDLIGNWNMFAYFQRYGKITLEPPQSHRFLITLKNNVAVPSGYIKMEMETYVYDLYQFIEH
jgi:4-amino-4-deoxy-L-arabinose transferase-like glycosyltransferase